MKKVLSMLLSIAILFGFVTPAYASESTNQQNVNGIVGTIIFQGEGITGAQITRSNNTAAVTVSYIENNDGSYTIFQYNDDAMIEEHTVTPGSGIVDHKFYNSDGTITKEREVVQKNPEAGISPLENSDPYSGLSAGASTRPLGYMHYTHPRTDEVFSIRCYVIDEKHINQPYSFNKNKAMTLSGWISTLLSIWMFYVNPPQLMKEVVELLTTWKILDGAITGILTVAITRTVRCTYYNQELHGVPTQPSGRGTHGRLDGTYCYLDVSGSGNIKTEGYTVRSWGTTSMGRQMMYKVFQLDEVPDTWINSGN